MSPAPLPTPSAEQIEEAFAKAGSTLRAAPLLDINYRTLERRMAASVELRAAANRGREKYAATQPRPPHGTTAGYAWELAHRPEVEPCAECRAANATYTRSKPSRRSRRAVA